MQSDAIIVLAARGLRAFGFGYVPFTMSVYLSELGLPPLQIAALVSVNAAGAVALMLLYSRYADRWGRRNILRLSALSMIVFGVVLAFAASFPWLLAIAILGPLPAGSSDQSGFTVVEQAFLAQIVRAPWRNRFFGVYNALAAVLSSLGALAARIPVDLSPATGVSVLDLTRAMFLGFAGISTVVFVLVWRLSPVVESAPLPGPHAMFRSRESRRLVTRFSAIQGFDAFAGAFAGEQLLSLWLHLRFNLELDALATIFFFTHMLAAVSQVAAGMLADRIGHIRTMVVSHLPANVMFLIIGFLPSVEPVIALLLVRSLLASMDVPARQALIVAMVQPSERTAATGFVNSARSLSASISPVIAGWIMQTFALGAPFVVTGALRVIYNVVLFTTFRHLAPDISVEEEKRGVSNEK